MSRRVMVSEWQKFAEPPYNRTVEVGEATFHQFGVDFNEFDEGPGNFSTAIVEFPDGVVKNVPVELIRFLSTEVKL